MSTKKPTKTRAGRVTNPRKRSALQKLRDTASQMAEVHRKRFEEWEADKRRCVLQIQTQAVLHAREIVELDVLLQKHAAALRTAVQLVSAARRNEWTPACDAEFAQVKESGSECIGG